jgi:hypothetical protein
VAADDAAWREGAEAADGAVEAGGDPVGCTVAAADGADARAEGPATDGPPDAEDPTGVGGEVPDSPDVQAPRATATRATAVRSLIGASLGPRR